MTSDRIARDYLQQAHARRIAVEALFNARAYPAVVRESHDVVELVLEGALRFVGIEPPKRHDIHDVVEQFIDRFPGEWRQTIGDLSATLTQLAQDRPRSSPCFAVVTGPGGPDTERIRNRRGYTGPRSSWGEDS